MNNEVLLTTLQASLTKALAKLDPASVDDGPPMQRLNALADKARSGFPLLVVAYEQGFTDDYGDNEERYFACHVVDDAIELVDILATLEVEHDLDELECYRLAPNSRDDGDGDFAEHIGRQLSVMGPHELDVMDKRVEAATKVKRAAAEKARRRAQRHARIAETRKQLERDRVMLERLEAEEGLEDS